jgi:hypothetical protein
VNGYTRSSSGFQHETQIFLHGGEGNQMGVALLGRRPSELKTVDVPINFEAKSLDNRQHAPYIAFSQTRRGLVYPKSEIQKLCRII